MRKGLSPSKMRTRLDPKTLPLLFLLVSTQPARGNTTLGAVQQLAVGVEAVSEFILSEAEGLRMTVLSSGERSML